MAADSKPAIRALLAALLCVACERGQPSPAPPGAASRLDTARHTPREFVGWGFALDPGAMLAVRRRVRGPDFDVYDVVARADSADSLARPLLSIYAGDHPAFTGDGLPATRIAGFVARDRRETGTSGRASRDLLVELPAAAETPSRLHCWYADATPEAAARADSLLNRLRATAFPGTR